MRAYLDNGATTKVDPSVVKAMLPYFREDYGNASSLHSLGQKAKLALDKSRTIIAKKINSKIEEVIFTSGGTESNNLAIKGVAYANKDKGNHIITSYIEHPSVMETCKELEKEGFKVTYLGVDKEGFIDLKVLKNVITDKTILITIMLANNEIGTIQDIESIGNICREKKIIFHTDAVQGFCKIPIDVGKINIDLISISSHKIHGPKGVGVLYIKKGTKIKSINNGGPQEYKLRAGTENIPGIVGFGKAVEVWQDKDADKILKLREYLIKNIIKTISDVILNGPREKRLCNNINFSFKYIEGESLISYLDFKGISASTGSACSSHKLEPSHVLLAIGLKPEIAHGSLRLTLSKFNTKEEIDYVLEQLPGIVKKLREMSPLSG